MASADGADGWPAERVFEPSAHYTFDDIVFLPGEKPAATATDVSTRVTRNVHVGMPIVGGPSGKATEVNMAIGLALIGGMGIIHKNQSISDQVAMVKQVKHYETGFILKCHTLGPRQTVIDAKRLQEEHGISGIPITENGRMGGKLVGLVTKRDMEVAEDDSAQLQNVMTKKLVTISEPVTLLVARKKMQEAKVGKLPVVNEDNQLVALICRGDLKRDREHPQASLDANRQLICGAAISASEVRCTGGMNRAKELFDAGVDLLCLDMDDGINTSGIDLIRSLKKQCEGVDILAGPVATSRQVRELCEAGVDGVLVSGGGPGSATTVYEIAKYARLHYAIPVLVDGGVQDSSSLLKALCLGASSVCLDSELLAGTEEAPGDYLFLDGGVRAKLYSTMEPKDTARVAMGTTSAIIGKSTVKTFVPRLLRIVGAGLQEIGLRNLSDIHSGLTNGTLRLERRAPGKSCVTTEPTLRLQRVAASGLHNRW